MTDHTVNTTKRASKPRARKFYVMDPDARMGGMPGYQMENKNVLLLGRHTLSPPPGQRGFPDYPEKPRFLFDKKLGRLPRDIEEYHAYWLISDRMKAALESVDPDGFAFVQCTTRFPDGTAGPAYWLCDVVRVFDAVDEATSRVKVKYDAIHHTKSYSLMGGANLVFNADIVGRAHVFRIPI